MKKYQTLFNPSTPSFLVVRGVVYVSLGGTNIVVRKDGVSYARHGHFNVLYAEQSWGVLRHVTIRGAELIIFVPPQKRMYVSNGRFSVIEVNYSSFMSAHDSKILVNYRNRREEGHLFLWLRDRGCWVAKENKYIVVTPPSSTEQGWGVTQKYSRDGQNFDHGHHATEDVVWKSAVEWINNSNYPPPIE